MLRSLAMKLSITLNDREHTLEITRRDGLSCLLDGVRFEAEALEVRPGVYSLLLGEKSFLAQVAPRATVASGPAGSGAGDYSVQVDGVHYAVSVRDPRRRPRGGSGLVLEGKQNITAPMPGKVVRILVAEGEAVQSGQGLIVMEAMKMQNEIKCPAAGKIQKVSVREGQAVNAGETLLVCG